MKFLVVCVCLCVVVEYVKSYQYDNETAMVADAVAQQLPDFRRRHPKPIGVWTTTTGDPIDIRDTVTLNTDLFNSKQLFRANAHLNRERIPERLVHAKGIGAYGYFEVTNDVSEYTTADVFTGIGKKTPLVGRLSTSIQNIGGSDLSRETKGISIKFYTEQGNLDLLCLNIPIFLYRDPMDILHFAHSFKRNPRTDAFDNNARWDFMISKPEFVHTFLWLNSDFGLPDGYRKMDIFAIHPYELYNKHGERFYVKFNFRTNVGLFNLTDAQAAAIGIEDPDYYNTDLYNAIAEKNYPSWRLDMDILTKDQLTHLDYDPFDLTRLWKRGTYRTVTVGKLVFNRLVDNHFKDAELAAYSPDNLVPGILGPADLVFRARKISYPDTQNYRLGGNHDNIRVNAPIYDKTYNRDGTPPVLDNMKDVPNYYANTFNGPIPYVDENRPTDRLFILHRNAVDLQPMAEFYNEIVDTDAHRQRIAGHFAQMLVDVAPDIEKKALYILTLIDTGLGGRVKAELKTLRAVVPQERRNRIAQCIASAS
ncbi:peroxisomal catalase 1-like [Helicoverpa zea]|uniref:peroxisomal catalase 1-like n=1 Tax=Helicoverpa zea TaxID=7113 RepID=UPI001F5AC03C|nr:peroxisomal catalase 1-like [Helicoverpa zea]